jgi:RimJ/RimL family protein N-acetyltransferase
MPAVLTTARLTLRPYTLADVDALHRLWNDAMVRKYLWDDRVVPRKLVTDTVNGSLRDWETLGYGQWSVRPRGDEVLIGFCGFRRAEWEDAPELLCGLASAHWGTGLATEAARAALHYGFDTLQFRRVVAAADTPNERSIRLMERLGMTFERQGMLNELHTVFYALLPDRFVP